MIDTSPYLPIAEQLGVTDLLVLEARDGELLLVGGSGRGAGWAGTVRVRLADEPSAVQARANGRPLRLSGPEPIRIIGPYWASHAVLVPVGNDHLVVAGSSAAIRPADGELLRHAAEAVAAVDGIPSAKLLADELEVVHAVRQLIEFRPENVSATARHVADIAAAALGCELAAVLVRAPFGQVVAMAGGDERCTDPRFCAELANLAKRVAGGPIVEQDVPDDGRLGRSAGLAARYTLGIGRTEQLGVLVVGHAMERPRGFTDLCQRVGRALADAAEVLIEQAIAREELAAERDRFAREARTDRLTGLANRIAWEEALEAEQERRGRYRRPVAVMSVDVDDLKATNDSHGHDAGDELLRAAAEILRSSLRSSDLVARVGGDEFNVLLPETESTTVEEIARRLGERCAAWRGARDDLRLSLSIGWAVPAPFGDLRETLRIADHRMYEAKLTR